MTDELEAALAWADTVTDQWSCQPNVRTLAAAVREAQAKTGCQACLDREFAQRQRAERAEADLAALKARTCRHCDKWDECGDSCGDGFCALFGVHVREDFTCGAWAAKERA